MAVAVAVPVAVGVGVAVDRPTVGAAEPALWLSGLTIVTVWSPGVAHKVETSSVTCVGSMYVTLFTITPPVTVAEMRSRQESVIVSGVSSNPERMPRRASDSDAYAALDR